MREREFGAIKIVRRLDGIEIEDLRLVMPQTQTPSQSFNGASMLARVRVPIDKTMIAIRNHSNSFSGCRPGLRTRFGRR